jgi:NADPH:quinone reductase-like Zn-dependent oxidoreductase
MREMVITRHGAPQVLELRERPDPEPGPGEVRIRVRASGVNFADILARVGLYPDAPPPPCVVGYEVCGHVDAVGAGVTRRREGDRVMALTRFGGYSDTVAVPEVFTFVPPARLSDVEAAAVPVTYLTAAVALYRMAALDAGEVVLVHGAGGGVGTAAVQLARLRNARVIGTASAAKHDAVLSLGVERCIDSRRDDVSRQVMALTSGRGVDVVLDPRGGRSARESYALLAPLGRLVVFGVSDAVPGTRRSLWRAARLLLQSPAFRPLALMNRNRGVFGLNLGRLWTEISRLHALMAFLIAELDAGHLAPIVARTFPLGQASAAHQFLHDRGNIGKVVLTSPSPP